MVVNVVRGISHDFTAPCTVHFRTRPVHTPSQLAKIRKATTDCHSYCTSSNYSRLLIYGYLRTPVDQCRLLPGTEADQGDPAARPRSIAISPFKTSLIDHELLSCYVADIPSTYSVKGVSPVGPPNPVRFAEVLQRENGRVLKPDEE